MAVVEDPQTAIDEQVIEGREDLEAALETRESRKNSKNELNRQFKEADDRAKALLSEFELADGEVARIGRFRIKEGHVDGAYGLVRDVAEDAANDPGGQGRVILELDRLLGAASAVRREAIRRDAGEVRDPRFDVPISMLLDLADDLFVPAADVDVLVEELHAGRPELPRR